MKNSTKQPKNKKTYIVVTCDPEPDVQLVEAKSYYDLCVDLLDYEEEDISDFDSKKALIKYFNEDETFFLIKELRNNKLIDPKY